jgi:hypothetical protein
MIIPWARADICGDCYVAVNGYRTNRSKHRSTNYLIFSSYEEEDSDTDTDDDDCEVHECILIDAAKHCCNAKAQRDFCNRLTAEAKHVNTVVPLEQGS